MKRWNAVLCAVLLPVLLVSASCGTVLSKDRLLEIIAEDINTVNADHAYQRREKLHQSHRERSKICANGF